MSSGYKLEAARWELTPCEAHSVGYLTEKCEILESEIKTLESEIKTLESEIRWIREYLRPLIDEMTVKNVNEILYGEGE